MPRRSLFAAAGLGGLAAACSPLTLFSTFAPRDGGGELADRHAAYGDDPRQTLDLYAPRPRRAGAPVVVFHYGGNWNSGRKEDYGWVARALTAQGFVAAVADYRLVPTVRFPAFLDDAAAAVAKAAALAPSVGGDPRRIVLMGHSAGAYLSAMLALERRSLQRAGVEARQVRALVGLSGPYDFFPYRVPATVAAFGDASPRESQPIAFASAAAPPSLLITGGSDHLVEPSNSIGLGQRLMEAGAHAEVKIYPGLDHAGTVLALSRVFRGRAPLLADVAQFIRAHAGAEQAGAGGA